MKLSYLTWCCTLLLAKVVLKNCTKMKNNSYFYAKIVIWQ